MLFYLLSLCIIVMSTDICDKRTSLYRPIMIRNDESYYFDRSTYFGFQTEIMNKTEIKCLQIQ